MCMDFMKVTAINAQDEKQKQDLIKKQYAKIYAHELAHKNAAGSLAGSIFIEKNSEGIPVSGHVPIKMPTIDEENPDKTIEQANIVVKAALAPSDPSDQDYRVAAEARAIKAQAEGIEKKKGLDYNA